MEDVKTVDVTVDGGNAPQKMTFLQNLILTVKVLAVLGGIGVAIWGIKLWKGME